MKVGIVRPVDDQPGAIRHGDERTTKAPDDGPGVLDDKVEDR